MTTMIVPPTAVPVAPARAEGGALRASQPAGRDRSAGAGQFAEVLSQHTEGDSVAAGDAGAAAPGAASASDTPAPDSQIVTGASVVAALAAAQPTGNEQQTESAATASTEGVPTSSGACPEAFPGAPVAGQACLTGNTVTGDSASGEASGEASQASTAPVEGKPATADPAALEGGGLAAVTSVSGDGVAMDAGRLLGLAVTQQVSSLAGLTERPASGVAGAVQGVAGTGTASTPVPGGADAGTPAPAQTVQPLPTQLTVPLPQAVPVPVLTPSASIAQAVAAPTPTHPSLEEQIAPRIASVRQLGDGVHRLTLRVEPEAIGAVRVVAEVRGDDVRLQLFGGTEAAREALRNALPDLRRDLATSGLQAQLDLGMSGERQPGHRTSRSDLGLSEGGNQRHDSRTGAPHIPGGGEQQNGALPGAGRLDVLA